METVFRGRVIEFWSDQPYAFVELVVGYDRIVFKGNEDVLKEVKRGDLVEIVSNHARDVSRIKKLGGSNSGNWSPLQDGMRWRKSLGSPSRMMRLVQRQSILTSIRQDLYSQGFLEIETPLLVKGTCPDTHIESIQAGQGSNTPGYLVTSTEYQIKRLIVGGFDHVFTLTKNFRANDQGRYHNHEFTMLEWARAYGTLTEIEEDAVRFIQRAFRNLYPQQNSILCNGNEVRIIPRDSESTWEKLTVREAFRMHLGIEDAGDFSLEALTQACQKAGIVPPPGFEKDKHLVLSFLLDRVQPFLGKKMPTFLRDWPAYMTSSAQLSEKDPYVAERSELYIGGIEIADGFPFLRDPERQGEFFARELQRRKEEGKAEVAIDELYLQALEEGIPPGAGMALGVDRLVMVLTGATQLSDVQAFSWEET